MKAKLLRGVSISDTETLAIGAEVEIIDGYCGTDGYYYMCKLPDGRQIGINSNHLYITDLTPYIDWEQRRYELAKAAMQGILSNENKVEYACSEAIYGERKHTIPIAIAQFALACANALIKELQEEK